MQIDDHPLARTPAIDAGDPEGPTDDGSSPRRSLPLVLLAIAGLLLGGATAWWWYRDPPAPARPVPTAGTEIALDTPAETARTLPPVGQMDTFLRALLGALSSSPELARWLATDDLIRQMAHVIDRVSRGQTPAADLAVIKPRDIFEVDRRRGQLTLDPASYRRYDGLASTVGGLDADAVARAYFTIRPRLDEAYRALGRSESGVDAALDAALAMLVATPAVRDPIALRPGKGATFAFADPALESLTPVQKQLLRMGPDNARRVQERLKQIADAIRAGKQVSR